MRLKQILKPWAERFFGRLDIRGVRSHLTLIFSLILGGTLAIFSLLLYQSFVDAYQEDFDIALYNHAVDVSNSINLKRISKSLQGHEELLEEKIFPFSLNRSFLQIRRISGEILASDGPVKSFELPFARTDAGLLRQGRDSTFHTLKLQAFVTDMGFLQSEHEDETFRLINFPLDEGPQPKLILQIAAPLTLFELQTESLRHFLYVGIPVSLFLAAFGGFFIAGRAMKPVGEMISKAEAIGVDRLSERLPVPPARDELRSLAQTMNGLLDRVEKSVLSQERFVADASHQLLTPLAIVRGELDTLREKDPEDVRRFLASASQEIDRLSRSVRDMLLLARVDAGRASLNREKLNVDEVVLEAAERVSAFVQAKNVRLRINLFSQEQQEGAFAIVGDRDLLLALFHNLIENAVKYSPREGLIDVSVSAEGGSIRVCVADQGPGISEQDLPRVFERFYRGSGTVQKTEGFGLGLAIAKTISEAHGASLRVASRLGEGAAFTFEISP